MASYAELRKKYAEGPSVDEKFRQQYAGPIKSQPASEPEKKSVSEKTDNAITEAISKFLPKATTTAAPKRDAAAYEQAKQAAKEEKAKKGYTEEQDASFIAPSQQLYDAAEKEYNDYINSEAHKNLKLQNMAIEAVNTMPANSASSYAARMQNQNLQQVQEDTKEKELRAKRDYYQRQVNLEETQRIMEADLAEFEKWPEEDKLKLQIYIENGAGSLNSLLGAVNGKATAQAFAAQKELEEKYGVETVDRLMRSVSRSKNAQLMQDAAAEGQQTGADHAVLGSIATVPMNQIGAISGPLGYMSEVVRGGKGQYPTLDPNNLGNLPNVYYGAVRGQVAEDISGDEYDEEGNLVKEGGAIRKAASIGYQGLMSTADSVTRAVATGGFSPVLAATGTFSQTVSEASKQGATPEQAMILGIGKAAVEYATEKIPLDNMLKAAKGGIKGAQKIAVEALRQGGIEATTEEISTFANMLVEAAVLREKSAYKQQIGEAIANGMTYAEAKAQADKAVMAEALNTLAVSTFAGILSGGGSAFVGRNAQTPATTEVEAQNVAEAAVAPDTQTQAEQPTQAQPQQDVAQAVAQELTQAQQAEADAKAAQEQAQEAIAQGMAEEYGPMMPQAEPKSQLQQNIDNATAAMLAENGIGQTPQTEAEVQVAQEQTNTQQEAQPVAEQNAVEETAAEQNKSAGAMESQFKHEVKRSAIYDNTYKNSPNADVRLIGREAERQDPNIGQYDAITEKESLHEAELRTETGRDRYSEYRYLLGKDGWTGADNDTAARLLDTYRREKKVDMFTALAKKQREMGTQAGQMVQSFAKYSRGNATDAATDAVLDLDNLTIDQIDTTFWNPKNEAKTKQEKKDALQKWKENVSASLLEVADDIDNVEDGDIESIKGIVRQLANLRHTTAWAGYSNELTRRTERGLDKMDFETLKTVAKTQLSMVPNDFRKRKPAEIIKQMRMQNMLFTLTTKLKNDTGNISNGLMDAVSDSFGGRMMDAIIGKYTGMRTVANDLKYAAEYRKAAKDAADVAGAFVSLDIPMETDAKYAVNSTRTWTPNTTNTLFRLASAFEKHLKYSLEVSDKFYEGGATHVVSQSLKGLGEKSGLTAEQIQDLARKTGERRTFKDPGYGTTKDGQPKKGRAGARVASGVQQALNQLGTEDIGAGDLLIPFAKVAAEVKQVGMDYTGSGIITGLGEVVSIIKDAKNGKEIDPYRQRSAATNFGRGITGVALTAAFAAMANAGAIKVHNEKDQEEKTMDQAQGLSGAQWNMDATLRWIKELSNGGSLESAQSVAKWEDGDELVTVDFLEPFNTQMHIGCLIAEGESIPESVLKGNFEAMLEMPMMQTFSDLADIQQAFTEVSDGDMSGVLDATGQLLGTVAGAAIPNAARKAAQVIDPYYRDTYDTNPIKKAGKQLVAGIPFVSQTLPEKYDNLGQEQRRYEEGDEINAAIDALVTPWDTDNYKTNPVYTEIERLNETLKNSDINVTPPQPKRKISYTDKTGVEHDGYVLTEDQYQKIAVTQGQTAKKVLGAMTKSMEYKNLTDVQKAYAINAAYEYAQEKGKQAALPDYYSKASAWIAETRESDTAAFIARGATKALDDAIGNAVNAQANNWAVSDAAKADMDATYKAFSKMYPKTQAKILDEASAETVRYIEYRKEGVSTQKYLDAKKKLDRIKPEEGYVNARSVQKAETVAGIAGLSEDQKTALVKLEVSDSQDKNIDEIKNMDIKNVNNEKIVFTIEDYVKLYRDHEDYTKGDGKKKRTITKWTNDYSISYDAAKALYEVFS